MGYDRTSRLLNEMKAKPISNAGFMPLNMTMPNHSGDHTAGTTKEPVKDEQIANKAYVDDMGVAHLAAYDHTQLHPALTLGVANGLTLSTGQVLNFPTNAAVTISQLTVISGNIKAPNNNTTHINAQTSDGLSYLNIKDKSGYWVIEASNWNPGLVLEAGIGLGNNTALFNYNLGGYIYFASGDIEVWNTNAVIYAKFYSASNGLSIGSTSAKTAPPTNGLLVEGEIAGNRISVSDGTVSAPSIVFGSDTHTGFYKIMDHYLGIATGGANSAYFSPDGLNVNKVYNNLGLPISLIGTQANSNTAVGVISDCYFTLSTVGSKLISFRNNSTEKAYIGYDGFIYTGVGIEAGGDITIHGTVYCDNGAVFQSDIRTSGSISGADIDGSTIYSYGTITAAGIIMAEGNRRVACGGGSTGSGTTANGTVTISINGQSYFLLTSATA